MTLMDISFLLICNRILFTEFVTFEGIKDIINDRFRFNATIPKVIRMYDHYRTLVANVQTGSCTDSYIQTAVGCFF